MQNGFRLAEDYRKQNDYENELEILNRMRRKLEERGDTASEDYSVVIAGMGLHFGWLLKEGMDSLDENVTELSDDLLKMTKLALNYLRKGNELYNSHPALKYSSTNAAMLFRILEISDVLRWGNRNMRLDVAEMLDISLRCSEQLRTIYDKNDWKPDPVYEKVLNNLLLLYFIVGEEQKAEVVHAEIKVSVDPEIAPLPELKRQFFEALKKN